LHDESWSQVQCDKDNSHSAWSDDSESYYGLDCDAMNRCRGTFLRSQFGAYLTTFTMIFALIGCLTRMRKGNHHLFIICLWQCCIRQYFFFHFTLLICHIHSLGFFPGVFETQWRTPISKNLLVAYQTRLAY